jgi:hypothetical protein
MAVNPQDPFSDAAIAQAVKDLPNLPADQVTGGFVAKPGDIGVEVEANKELGKGFFAEADASWWQKTGWKAAAMFGWRKKP